MKFKALVLSEAADFLVENREDLEKEENGVTLQRPHVFNEEEKVQKVKAREIWIPYSSIENIQYGEFDHEKA